jgi:Domain of unknown function (DUF4259)
MNVWGPGSFENDSAAEFVKEVLEDGQVALEEAFGVTLDPDAAELEAEEGARAVAAAEIVLAQLSGDTEAVSHTELLAWLTESESDPDELERLRELALESLERVLGPGSELPELWQDGEEGSEWLTDVMRLRTGLGG